MNGGDLWVGVDILLESQGVNWVFAMKRNGALLLSCTHKIKSLIFITLCLNLSQNLFEKIM